MPARFKHARSPRKALPFIRRAGLLFLALLSGACFTYQTHSTELVKPNEEIRLIVTDAAAMRLTQQFGVIPPFEGRLSPLSADSFGLAVWVGRGFSGSDFATVRQTVPVLRSDILGVERRQLSIKRTAYFTAGVVVALTILVDRLGVIDLPFGGDSEPPTPPEPEPFRRWLRR